MVELPLLDAANVLIWRCVNGICCQNFVVYQAVIAYCIL